MLLVVKSETLSTGTFAVVELRVVQIRFWPVAALLVYGCSQTDRRSTILLNSLFDVSFTTCRVIKSGLSV